jgi:ABC-type branched-subunit amino acid transport system ATPase component
MTDVLKLNLQHCYGIVKLEAELEFTHKGFAIYAPNGVMKTSFAKTMMDLSKGASPRLRTHNQNITVAARMMAERKTVGLLS